MKSKKDIIMNHYFQIIDAVVFLLVLKLGFIHLVKVRMIDSITYKILKV